MMEAARVDLRLGSPPVKFPVMSNFNFYWLNRL